MFYVIASVGLTKKTLFLHDFYVMRPLFWLSTIVQESQQSASRVRVLAFYRIAPCLRLHDLQCCFPPAVFPFSPIIPCAEGKMHVLLKRNGAIGVLSACVFCSGFLFKSVKVFTGRCRCSEWQKASNNVCINSVKFYFSFCLYFNLFRFVSLQFITL